MATKKILVVDDDLQTVKLVGLVLDRRGYEITAARRGEEALEKARNELPDMVILDVMMPDMNGYEVSRQLRADPETADLPILMFTAKSGVQDKVTGFEAGADDFLTKPIHPKELVSRVEALLLRSSRAQPKEKPASPNCIGFIGCKGGVGTTTLIVNTAVSLATGQVTPAQAREPAPHPNGPVVVAELRTGMATAALQLGLPQHDGLGIILNRSIGQIDAEFIEAQLDEHQSGLLLLGSESGPIRSARRGSAEHADAVVRHLGAMAGYLFADLGVGLDELNERVLARCRHVVVAIAPNSIALALAEELLEQMNQELQIPRHRISLILIKRSRSAASYTKEEIEEQLGHSLIGMIPPAPELAFESSKQRTPMVLVHLDSLVVRQYRSFAKDLTGKL